MKKLLLDTCPKTAFMFNGAIYEQKDGVCMGPTLGPLLANVIMIDLEEKVIKFYARYVDDTLFVIKHKNVGHIQNLLNNIDSNLCFTVDLFQNEVHFLDLELSPDGILIFRKNTNTCLYTQFSSYVPWTHRTAWIKSLTLPASCICMPNKLSSEINFIKKLAYWNSFPLFVTKKIICQVLNTTDESTNNAKTPGVLTIYVVCLTIVTKDFHYSSLVCTKFDLIASKLVPLDLGPNMMLIKLSFIVTPKIKQLFLVICL